MMTNTSALVLNHDGDKQKATLYSLGALLVIFINSMTIVSYLMRNKSKRGIPDLFMLSLAVSSILTMVAVILILAYVRATGNENFTGLMPLCYIQVLFGTMLRMLDVSVTTAITIDRFIALYKPLVYRVKFDLKHGKIVCAILWLSSAMISILPFVGFGRISIHMQSFCTADWTSNISYIVLTLAYTQFAIVLLCYVGIFRAISGLVNRQKTMKKSQSLSYMSPTPPRKNGVTNEPFLVSSMSLDETQRQKQVSGLCNFAFERRNLRTTSLDFTMTPPHNDESQLVKASLQTPENLPNISREESSLDVVTEEEENPFLTRKTPSVDMSKSNNCNPPLRGNINSRSKNTNRVSWIDTTKGSEACQSNDSITQTKTTQKLTKTLSTPLPYRDKSDPSSFTRAISDTSISSKSKKKSFGSLLRHLSKRNKNRTPNASIKDFRTESQRFAKIMGVVVCLFYISWLPLAISINIVLVNGLEYFINNYYNILWLSYNLSLTSSIAIPIAYAVMCKPYRASYKALWKFVKNRFVWKGEIKLA